MNVTTILDLITEREAAAGQTAALLREQITTLTAQLAQIDSELTDLATTGTMLRTLAATEFTAEDPTVPAPRTSRSCKSSAPHLPACGRRTSALPSMSNPHRNTSKAPARS